MYICKFLEKGGEEMNFAKEIENALEEAELNFNVEDLEEVVTPGSGFGCDCNWSLFCVTLCIICNIIRNNTIRSKAFKSDYK